MNAAARLRFEKKLAHRLSEECCDISVQWIGSGPEPDYAVVRAEKAGAAMGMAISCMVIESARSPAFIIEEAVGLVLWEYQRFELSEGVKG